MILCTSPSSNGNVIIHVNKSINSYLRVFNVFISLSPPFFGGGQEYWGGLPFPSPRDHPEPGIEPRSPAL